jgi:signal transduction histidine kinase
MKISYIILLSFFCILILFSFTTYINYQQSVLVNSNAEDFARSSTIVRQSNRFQRNFLTMVSGLRGYLLTDETFFIQTYDSAILENESILNQLNQMVREGSEQRILLDEIQELHRYWVNEFAAPLLEAKSKTNQSDSSKLAFNKLYRAKLVSTLEKDVQRSLQQKFATFTNTEYGFRDSQKELLNTAVQKTRSISFVLTAISVVAGIIISVFIAGYISSRIVKMVHMANAIGSGDYTATTIDSGNSELSQLARALNNMASILNSNISLLRRQRDELDQFAHIVSHDIKAPLRGIDNVVTWIEEDHSFDLPAKVKDYLGIIKGRIIRAENLLKGILTYARIGRESLPKEVVHLNELLAEVEECIPKNKAIKLKVAPNLPVLYTERVPLQQIFTNLIVNAFRYHDKEAGTVSVYHKVNGKFYEFYVEDDGPGIAESYHKKIFVIFQTLNGRDTFESTGVGLSIIKKILDDKNLKINLQSEPGKGAKFSFTWPTNEEYHAESN